MTDSKADRPDDDPVGRAFKAGNGIKVVILVLLVVSGLVRLWQLAVILALLAVAAFV